MLAKLLFLCERLPKLAGIAVFCISLLNSLAYAKTLKESQKVSEKVPQNTKLWSSSITSSNYTNTIQNTYEEMHISGAYSLGITRNLPSIKSSLSMNAGYVLEYTHRNEDTDRNGDWMNPGVSYRYKFGDKNIFKRVTMGLDSTFPVSRGARGRSMVVAAGPMTAWGFDMGRFSLNQKLGYIYTAFTYDTSLTGEMNSPHTVSFGNNLGLQITDNWSTSLIFVYVSATDYEGIVRTSTNTVGSINWTVAKNFSTSLGLVTNSGTLSPMGDYHRLNLYDINKANAFLDLTLTF